MLGLIVAPILAIIILGCNLVQMCSLVLYPIHRPSFRNMNEAISATWWWCMYMAVTKILRRPYVMTGLDELPQRENVIVISNHQGMVDIPWIMAIAHLKGSGARAKFFVKDPIKWVPGVGWAMHFLNYIFLKREWTRDANSVLATFETIRKDKIPFFLVNFPEGTRATPKKLQASQEFAQKRGIPVLNHCLIPRTKGVVSTIQGLNGHFDAVYDITLAYDKEHPPTLPQFFLRTQGPVRIQVDRIPANALPRGETALTEWLQSRFRKKDALLDRLYS